MLTLLRHRSHQRLLPTRRILTRTLVDLSSITPVRDRALDHAVEKEHNLIPLLSLKDLLKSSPSHSLPLSLIKSSPEISLPIRHIDFIRRYPAIFQEHLPGGISNVDPHIKLSPDALSLHEEEQSVLNSEINLVECADRVLKLLMISGSRKIPLPVIERLRFDLGLPHDFVRTLIPNFPDYFQMVHDELELVCWNDDLAVSFIEKRAKNYEKGMPIEFPMKFSTGFEMEKKFKKWVDEWQKIPYISPYENAMHLSAKSDEGDKWVVSVLHEVMSLLYTKKTDRENLLFFGECLGLRARIRQALLHHPGIFYISRKLGSHMVVLRDGYKRDLLVEKHPLMGIRYKYIHLMNMVVEEKKEKAELAKEKKPVLDAKEEGEEKVVDEVSGSEVDDENEEDEDDDEDDEEDEEDEDENKALSRPHDVASRGRTRENSRFEGKRAIPAWRENRFGDRRSPMNRQNRDNNEDDSRRFSRENSRGNRGRTRENIRFEGKRFESDRDRSNQRRPRNSEIYVENEGKRFSENNSRGNRNRSGENPRFEGETVDRERSTQRRPRNYEVQTENEGKNFSKNDFRGNRNRSGENPRFERKRVEFGRDGPKERRTMNYKSKDVDEARTHSHANRDNRGRTKDSPKFGRKRDFESSNESGRDGSYQRRSRRYGENSKREGFNSKRNDSSRSKGSRYKESSRSGMGASA